MALKRTDDDEFLYIIEDFRSEYGYAPTYRELAERVGLSTSTIGYRIKHLRKEGLLEDTHTSSARTLVPTRAGIQRVTSHRDGVRAPS